MSEADGEYKRTVTTVFSSHPIQHIHERSANPRWNEDFHIRRRPVHPTRRMSRRFICGTVRLRGTPKYLCVTLDRTLSYKTHNTKMKVASRNNLLNKLANSRWGTNARTIRTTALALCYSTAEYAAQYGKGRIMHTY